MTRADALAGRRVYFDTNVFIYALNGFPPFDSVLARLSAMMDAGQLPVVTSELTLAEILVRPMRDGDATAEQTCREMLLNTRGLTPIPLTRQILIESARLRAVHPIKLPDAIHLATATLVGCDVLVTNDARFRQAKSTVEVLLLSDMQP